jgi:hypothetical protein
MQRYYFISNFKKFISFGGFPVSLIFFYNLLCIKKYYMNCIIIAITEYSMRVHESFEIIYGIPEITIHCEQNELIA